MPIHRCSFNTSLTYNLHPYLWLLLHFSIILLFRAYFVYTEFGSKTVADTTKLVQCTHRHWICSYFFSFFGFFIMERKKKKKTIVNLLFIWREWNTLYKLLHWLLSSVLFHPMSHPPHHSLHFPSGSIQTETLDNLSARIFSVL